MYSYHAEQLNGFFHPNSVVALQLIFNKLNNPSVTAAETAKLQSEFLSIVELEKSLTKACCFVSPNGMNFIFCIFEQGKYVLLNPYGVTLLFQDWRIFDGELSVPNVQWVEQDNIVILDVYYIVRNHLQKCICHFSNDGNHFVYFTELQQTTPMASVQSKDHHQRYFEETIWLCDNCSSVNLMSDRFCTNCRAPRSW